MRGEVREKPKLNDAQVAGSRETPETKDQGAAVHLFGAT